ncbi:MAG: SGNH/GDSL hydrolase family protein [Acidimicrobiales bacterium]
MRASPTVGGTGPSRLARIAVVGLALLLVSGCTDSAQGHRSTVVPATGTRGAPPVTTSMPAVPSSTTTTALTTDLPTVTGHVVAVGDSVMLDDQGNLESDIPGITVDAAVSRQWSDGETLVGQLKAGGGLGSVVVIALGTNGPITAGDFTAMMALLAGVPRVVFVTVHVDRPWQDPNNEVITAGASQYPNVVVADWATLAAGNPGWFYSDGTHLPIGGTGAQMLAALITRACATAAPGSAPAIG